MATNAAKDWYGGDGPGILNLGLHPRQAYAFASPATEILYGGAKGGGKSHLMRVAAITWCTMIPGLHIYLFRRTSPDLFRNHMGPGGFTVMLSPWIPGGWAAFNGAKNYWQFWNGSRIWLCHCQYDKDKDDYQGAEMHVLMVDQLEQWTYETYKFLRGQVRLGGLQVPEQYKGLFPRVLSSANPGGIGHNWVKGEFVDVSPTGKIVRMPKDQGGMKRQYVKALLEDNPTMAETDPNYEDRLADMGSPEMVKALRYGIWDIVAGGAIDDVWDPNIHIIPPFHIPKGWRVDRAFDWGSSKPFSVGWWAEANGEEILLKDGTVRRFAKGTKIRVAEWYGAKRDKRGQGTNDGLKLTPGEIAKGIRDTEALFSFAVTPGPADSSIFDSDVTIASDMLKQGVRWEEADKRPGSRVAGLVRLRTMLKASKQKPMEAPGLFVFDTCKEWIRTVPALCRDPKKTDDIQDGQEDHIYDESRYEIMTPPREDGVVRLPL